MLYRYQGDKGEGAIAFEHARVVAEKLRP